MGGQPSQRRRRRRLQRRDNSPYATCTRGTTPTEHARAFIWAAIRTTATAGDGNERASPEGLRRTMQFRLLLITAPQFQNARYPTCPFPTLLCFPVFPFSSRLLTPATASATALIATRLTLFARQARDIHAGAVPFAWNSLEIFLRSHGTRGINL